MNQLRLALLAILLTGINSCDCDKKYWCAALSDEAQGWLNQELHDTVRFQNAFGNQMGFVVTIKSISPPYEEQACINGGIGCSCDYECEANGRFWATSDTSINGFGNYSIFIEESGYDNTATSSVYTIYALDFIGKVDLLNPGNNLSPNHTILPSITLGNLTYYNVHSFAIDTTISYNQNKTVWTIYFTKAQGLIGFHERKFHSTFYRE